MTDKTIVSPAPKKRRGLRILGWIAGVLIILIVAAYFVGTNSGFVKSVILPRVGKSLNAEITVSDAEIHPFSAVILRDLKVTPNGRETLLTAPEIRARYSLLDIIRGNIKVEEITITSPTIHVVENPDGSRNFDPLLTKKEQKPKEPSSKAPRIDLRKLALSNATVRQEKLYAGGKRDVIEISNINVTLTNLKNGGTGKLVLSANASIQNNPPAPGTNGVLQATVNGEYVFAFSAELKPLTVKGQTQLSVSRAEGSLADLAGLAANLNADVSPTEITLVALQFQKSGETLAQLRVNGPFDMEKTEGRLKVELLSLDRRVLNLIGASSGIDFGTTQISSTNEVQIASAASAITVAGRFNVDKLQLTRTNQTTPTLDIHADYNLTLDRAASNAVIRTLTLTGTQNGKPLLDAALSSPMTIALGNTNASVGDSTFNLTIANLNVADWKPFLGDALSEGNASLKLKVLSQKSGQQLKLNLASQLANFAPVGGDKKLASAAINADLSVQLDPNQTKVITGGVQFSNVVVNDPSGAIPSTPLEARLDLDTTIGMQAVDLRRLQVTLTPTARAQNQILLQGRIDLSNTNATQGNLKLTSDSLDLTSYYDLFTGTTQTNQAAKTATSVPKQQPSGPVEPQREPDPVKLPFQNFVAEASIGRLYLREVAVTNLQTTVKIDGGHLVLKPFQLTLNGAPVSGSADLDLSVPGYRYAVEFTANRIPIAPLADSFAKAYRGKAQGNLIANLNLKGAGITGGSLQTNLSGNASLSFTNANIQLVGPKMRLIIVPISMALRIPEVADSPLNWLAAEIQIGDGKINLSQVRAVGPAFAASSQGTIAIAEVVNDSRIQKLPINFALSRPLAARAGFKGSSDTNNAYVDLGAIAHVSGTLGKPDTKVDYGRIALLTGEQFIGGTAGQVLRGIGGATTGTNGVGGLVQDIGGIFGVGKTTPTNTPATNQPAPTATNQVPLGNIFNQLLGPKKK